MPKQFFISLKAMIQNDDGRILFLVKEREGGKYLDLPGGRMEEDDTFESTLKRELEEELSLIGNIDIIKQVGDVWELPSKFMKNGNKQLVITFLIKTHTSDISLSDEHTEHLWVGKDDLKNLEPNGYIVLNGYRKNLELLFS